MFAGPGLVPKRVWARAVSWWSAGGSDRRPARGTGGVHAHGGMAEPSREGWAPRNGFCMIASMQAKTEGKRRISTSAFQLFSRWVNLAGMTVGRR